MRRRTALIAVPALVVFLALSFVLARFLVSESSERDQIVEVLDAQLRGDAAGVLAKLDACDAACERDVRAGAARLRGRGDILIARLDSETAYSAFGDTEGWARVVWTLGPDGRPVVQCVRVRREGNPVTGRSVTLLRLGAPLSDNEGSCS